MRDFMEVVPKLTGLKSVWISNMRPKDDGTYAAIADKLKMELYVALRPRGGSVEVYERKDGKVMAWKNGSFPGGSRASSSNEDLPEQAGDDAVHDL